MNTTHNTVEQEHVHGQVTKEKERKQWNSEKNKQGNDARGTHFAPEKTNQSKQTKKKAKLKKNCLWSLVPPLPHTQTNKQTKKP